MRAQHGIADAIKTFEKETNIAPTIIVFLLLASSFVDPSIYGAECSFGYDGFGTHRFRLHSNKAGRSGATAHAFNGRSSADRRAS